MRGGGIREGGRGEGRKRGRGDGGGEVLDKNSEFQTSLFPVDSNSADLRRSLKFCIFLKSSPGGFYARSVSEMLTSSHLSQREIFII